MLGGGTGGTGDPPIATNVGLCPATVVLPETIRRTEIAVTTTSSARRNVRIRFFTWLSLRNTNTPARTEPYQGEPMPRRCKCQYISAQIQGRRNIDIMSLNAVVSTNRYIPLVTSSHIFHDVYNVNQCTLQQFKGTGT